MLYIKEQLIFEMVKEFHEDERYIWYGKINISDYPLGETVTKYFI